MTITNTDNKIIFLNDEQELDYIYELIDKTKNQDELEELEIKKNKLIDKIYFSS